MVAERHERQVVRPVSIGAAIKSRRAYLGLTAEQLVDETHGVLSLRLLSRIENGHVSPASLKLGKYRALLKALRLTPGEFEELTGVPAGLPEPEEIPGATPYGSGPTLAIAVGGTATGFLSGGGIVDEPTSFVVVGTGLPGLRGRTSTNLVSLTVDPAVLVSDGANEHCRVGANLIVELGAVPGATSVVVGWSERHDCACVKLAHEGSGTIMRSLDPTGPVFRVRDGDVDVRGVVRTIFAEP